MRRDGTKNKGSRIASRHQRHLDWQINLHFFQALRPFPEAHDRDAGHRARFLVNALKDAFAKVLEVAVSVRADMELEEISSLIVINLKFPFHFFILSYQYNRQ